VVRIFLLGMLVALVPGNWVAAADFNILQWTFDKDAPGDRPSGVVIGQANAEAGRWEVAADTTVGSTKHVLGRIPSDRPNPAPQVIFLDSVETMNLDLTVRIRAPAGEDNSGGGVVFRADDERNYYVAWLSPQEKLVRIDKVVNGEVKTLGDLHVESMEPGQWHALRLTIRGAELEGLFDYRQYIAAREEAWEFGRYKKGKVGLWARGRTAVYFDGVHLTSMDGGTGSAPLGGTESTIIK